jgi:NTE family protein
MRTIALALTLSLMAGGFAAAAEVEKRPKVGLVLGGGGARGAAHIGVLEVLEENHIPIDCIAGTSMGALVAGAYAGRRLARRRCATS